MKAGCTINLGLLVLLTCLPVMAPSATVPPANPRAIVRVPDDIVQLKQLAEAGNLHAQLALAKRYYANEMFADGYACYRKAAETGSMDAIYQVGHVLLVGALGNQPNQRVVANPIEGIRWIYRAATNLYPAACADMAFALQNGLGVKTNLAQAYAWLLLYAEGDPDRGPAIAERFALRMNTAILLEGRRLAADFKKSNWPPPPAGGFLKILIPLKLTGVSLSGGTPLAIINRRTLSAGESTNLPLQSGGTISLKCLEIRQDAVLVEVAGEGGPRWLRFENSVAAANQL